MGLQNAAHIILLSIFTLLWIAEIVKASREYFLSYKKIKDLYISSVNLNRKISTKKLSKVILYNY